MFPDSAKEMLKQAFHGFEIQAETIGDAVVALCSGYLDGLNGSTLNVDGGSSFADNVLTAGPWLLESMSNERNLD